MGLASQPCGTRSIALEHVIDRISSQMPPFSGCGGPLPVFFPYSVERCTVAAANRDFHGPVVPWAAGGDGVVYIAEKQADLPARLLTGSPICQVCLYRFSLQIANVPFSGPWIVGVLASPRRPQRRKSIYSLALRRPPPSILSLLSPLFISLLCDSSILSFSLLVRLLSLSLQSLVACFRRSPLHQSLLRDWSCR